MDLFFQDSSYVFLVFGPLNLLGLPTLQSLINTDLQDLLGCQLFEVSKLGSKLNKKF